MRLPTCVAIVLKTRCATVAGSLLSVILSPPKSGFCMKIMLAFFF